MHKTLSVLYILSKDTKKYKNRIFVGHLYDFCGYLSNQNIHIFYILLIYPHRIKNNSPSPKFLKVFILFFKKVQLFLFFTTKFDYFVDIFDQNVILCYTKKHSINAVQKKQQKRFLLEKCNRISNTR